MRWGLCGAADKKIKKLEKSSCFFENANVKWGLMMGLIERLQNRGCKTTFMKRQVVAGMVDSEKKWKVFSYSLGVFVTAFLVAFFAGSLYFVPREALADTNSSSAASADGYTLSLSATSAINLGITVSDSDTMTVEQGSVSVITTSPGYELFISMSGDSTALNGIAEGISGSIAAVSGSVTAPAALTRGTWGYAIPGNTTNLVGNGFNTSYSPMSSTTPDTSKKFAAPTAASSPQMIASSSNSTTGDNYPVFYAVRANSSTAPGDYSNTVMFTAVADAAASNTATATPNRINSSTATNVTLKTSLYSTAGYANTNVYFLTATQYGQISGTNVEALGVNPIVCKKTSNTPVTYSCTIPSTSTAGIYYLYAKFPEYNTVYSVMLPVMNSSVKFFTATTMQQFTDSTYCSSATTPATTATSADTTGKYNGNTAYVPQTTLTDTRNGEVYTVRKLADGNCWMTENLRLEFDGTSATGLTASDSDIASTYTSSNPLVIGATQPYNQGSSNYYNWGIGTSGTLTQANTDKWLSRSTKKNGEWATETNPIKPGASSANLTGEDQKTGVFYNWYTATAGTGNWNITTGGITASSSVCPAGWQLPRYSAVNSTSTLAPTGSWMNLIRDTYHIIATQGDQGSGSTANAKLHAFPFSLPYFGYVDYVSGDIVNYGSGGWMFWSAGSTSQTGARGLDFYGTYVWPEGGGNRLNGFSIRCVAK